MKTINKKNTKEYILRQNPGQEGVALVMALLILSLMMTSAIALSRIIIGEVKMAINTVNSMNSYYAADSGIEKSLYYIKYTREKGDDAAFNSLYNKEFNIENSRQSFKFTELTTSTPGFLVYDITTSTPAHVDITDFSGDISGGTNWGEGGGHQYLLEWVIEDCFPYHASDKLEVTTYAFSNDSNFEVSTDKYIAVCNCTYADDTCDETLTTKSISNTKFYRFSFRPLDSTVESIDFNVYDSSPAITGIPSNASITTDGNYKNSKYRLKVEIPTIGALSDVFSYVIFSEEILEKENF
jgi:hypothetical protein